MKRRITPTAVTSHPSSNTPYAVTAPRLPDAHAAAAHGGEDATVPASPAPVSHSPARRRWERDDLPSAPTTAEFESATSSPPSASPHTPSLPLGSATPEPIERRSADSSADSSAVSSGRRCSSGRRQPLLLAGAAPASIAGAGRMTGNLTTREAHGRVSLHDGFLAQWLPSHGNGILPPADAAAPAVNDDDPSDADADGSPDALPRTATTLPLRLSLPPSLPCPPSDAVVSISDDDDDDDIAPRPRRPVTGMTTTTTSSSFEEDEVVDSGMAAPHSTAPSLVAARRRPRVVLSDDEDDASPPPSRAPAPRPHASSPPPPAPSSHGASGRRLMTRTARAALGLSPAPPSRSAMRHTHRSASSAITASRGPRPSPSTASAGPASALYSDGDRRAAAHQTSKTPKALKTPKDPRSATPDPRPAGLKQVASFQGSVASARSAASTADSVQTPPEDQVPPEEQAIGDIFPGLTTRMPLPVYTSCGSPSATAAAPPSPPLFPTSPSSPPLSPRLLRPPCPPSPRPPLPSTSATGFILSPQAALPPLPILLMKGELPKPVSRRLAPHERALAAAPLGDLNARLLQLHHAQQLSASSVLTSPPDALSAASASAPLPLPTPTAPTAADGTGDEQASATPTTAAVTPSRAPANPATAAATPVTATPHWSSMTARPTPHRGGVLQTPQDGSPRVSSRHLAYNRWMEPHEDELARRVEYDLDDQDYQWLVATNARHAARGWSGEVYQISETLMETVMDRCEKIWFDLNKKVAKHPIDAIPYPEDINCAVCDDGECENSNAIVFCDGCNLAVHQDCYGVPYIPEGPWLCRKCMTSPEAPVSCILCPNEGGAFKRTDTNAWAHLVCANWIPEVVVANVVFMEPIDVSNITRDRWRLLCMFCHRRHGACIQCSNKHCYNAFHVTCANRKHLKMKVSPTTGDMVLRAYCPKHVPGGAAGSGGATSPTAAAAAAAAVTRKSALAYSRHITDQPSVAMPQLGFERVVHDVAELFPKVARQPAAVVAVCRYWALKRLARRGAPLLKRLHLEPWTASATDLMQDEDAKAKRHAALSRWRSGMESLRTILTQVLRREKKKAQRVRIQEAYVLRALNPMQRLIEQIYHAVVKLDTRGFFAYPVSAAEVPDYYDVITHPMDFQTLKGMIDAMQVETLDAMEGYVLQICQNARLYNKESTPYARLAVRIMKALPALVNHARDAAAAMAITRVGDMLHPRLLELDVLFHYGDPPGYVNREPLLAAREARQAAVHVAAAADKKAELRAKKAEADARRAHARAESNARRRMAAADARAAVSRPAPSTPAASAAPVSTRSARTQPSAAPAPAAVSPPLPRRQAGSVSQRASPARAPLAGVLRGPASDPLRQVLVSDAARSGHGSDSDVPSSPLSDYPTDFVDSDLELDALDVADSAGPAPAAAAAPPAPAPPPAASLPEATAPTAAAAAAAWRPPAARGRSRSRSQFARMKADSVSTSSLSPAPDISSSDGEGAAAAAAGDPAAPVAAPTATRAQRLLRSRSPSPHRRPLAHAGFLRPSSPLRGSSLSPPRSARRAAASMASWTNVSTSSETSAAPSPATTPPPPPLPAGARRGPLDSFISTSTAAAASVPAGPGSAPATPTAAVRRSTRAGSRSASASAPASATPSPAASPTPPAAAVARAAPTTRSGRAAATAALAVLRRPAPAPLVAAARPAARPVRRSAPASAAHVSVTATPIAVTRPAAAGPDAARKRRRRVLEALDRADARIAQAEAAEAAAAEPLRRSGRQRRLPVPVAGTAAAPAAAAPTWAALPLLDVPAAGPPPAAGAVPELALGAGNGLRKRMRPQTALTPMAAARRSGDLPRRAGLVDAARPGDHPAAAAAVAAAAPPSTGLRMSHRTRRLG